MKKCISSSLFLGIYKKCPFYDQLRIVFSRPNINLNSITSATTTIKTPYTIYRRAGETPQTPNNNSDNKLFDDTKHWSEEETLQLIDFLTENPRLEVSRNLN